jgi:hypothetical protein
MSWFIDATRDVEVSKASICVRRQPMKLAALSPACRAWLATCLYDSLIEKHEGPWDWGGYLLDGEDHAEFLVLDGYEGMPALHSV